MLPERLELVQKAGRVRRAYLKMQSGIRNVTKGIAAAIVIIVGGLNPTLASAATCPTETENVRTAEANGLQLPDCRAYEQVSPVEKNLTDARGIPGFVQSSNSGDAVTYFSYSPFPGVQGATEFPTYLSSRGINGWSTQSLLPPAAVGSPFAAVIGLTYNLGYTILYSNSTEPPLALGATPKAINYYVHNNLLGTYQLLAPGPGEVQFDDSTPGGTLVLYTDTAKEVVPGVIDESGTPYLYEWDAEAGTSVFIGYLPAAEGGGVPKSGTVAGSQKEPTTSYDEGTMSRDGSRVFFTDLENGRIYMRYVTARKTIPVSSGSAFWRAATPDGTAAFYTEGGVLYRFDVATESAEPLTNGAVGVLGTVGASEDGSYVYFVATVALSGQAVGGRANLYEWHEGVGVNFIATLAGLEEDEKDGYDWESYKTTLGPAQGEKSSRVAAPGTAMLFISSENLTKYDSAKHYELYLYNALSAELRCVSCNPSGIPAKYDTYLAQGPGFSGQGRNAFLTNNLSDDGSRVFFQTKESLLPQDTNGQMDVYEWEKEGKGSCLAGDGSGGGCLYLISSGRSSSESNFGEASPSGDDVFIFTRQPLVGQDDDASVDVYDARVDGGIATQNPPLPPSPCSSEICRGPGAGPLALATPASVAISGIGNLVPAPEPKQGKPHNKAKKRHKIKKKRKSRRVTRSSRRRSGRAM